MLNDMLLQYRRVALEKGLAALSEKELLLMVTVRAVRRGIGPEVPQGKGEPYTEPNTLSRCLGLATPRKPEPVCEADDEEDIPAVWGGRHKR